MSATGDMPAFPLWIGQLNGPGYLENGLTKRELFAAMAMQGLLAKDHDLFINDLLALPLMAVTTADALIKELNK